MAEFKREKVLFHIIGQGEIDVEYEVGAETPEQAFRRAYDESVAGITKLMIVSDVEFVTTVATEPVQSMYAVEKNVIDGRLDADSPYKVMVGATPWFFTTLTDAQEFIDQRGVEDLEWLLTNAKRIQDELDERDDPDWESRINWTNRSDVELAHHLSSDHNVTKNFYVNRSEMNSLHDRAHEMADERESDEYARAREDEADQWRMNR